MSKTGSAAKVKLNSFNDLFDDKIDLIHSQHGELELLANFPQLILGADW